MKQFINDVEECNRLIAAAQVAIDHAEQNTADLVASLVRIKEAYERLAYQWSKVACTPSTADSLIRTHILEEFRASVLSDYLGWSEKAKKNL